MKDSVFISTEHDKIINSKPPKPPTPKNPLKLSYAKKLQPACFSRSLNLKTDLERFNEKIKVKNSNNLNPQESKFDSVP